MALFSIPSPLEPADSNEIQLGQTKISRNDSLLVYFQRPFLHMGCSYMLYNTQGELMLEKTLTEAELRQGYLPIPWANYYPGRYILSFEGPFKRAFIIELF